MTENDPTGGKPDGAPAPVNVPVQDSEGSPPVPDAVAPVALEADEGDPADGTEVLSAAEPARTPEEKKIAQEAFAKRALQRENKRLADELAALKANGTPKPATPTSIDAEAAEANAPEGGYADKATFDQAVRDEASRRVQVEARQRSEAEFNAACNAVFDSGVSAYRDDFKQAVDNLRSVGVLNRDVLDLVLATDDPAKVLFDLGSDPEKASALLEMSPGKRVVEIAKLAIGPTKKAADPLSNAPPPIRPVEGSARVVGEPRDDDDDKAWFAKRLAQKRERVRA